MKLKTLILLSRIKSNSFFRDLKEYLIERVNENKLTDKNIDYIYNNLYKGKSDFIRQNIYPVGEFLAQGHSAEETEKLASLLTDAYGKTIFSYDKEEKGDKFNKLFGDLRYIFVNYDNLLKFNDSKEDVFSQCKELMETTNSSQRVVEVLMYDGRVRDSKELQEYYKENEEEMNKLRTEFNSSFPENQRDKKETRIMVAGTILAGIALRNLQRENNNLDGGIEKSPYTLEQEKMIDKYTSLEETQNKINTYVERNLEIEETEEEIDFCN
ncbi:MAG: hypothetical protein Q4G05_00335 [Clostridia bacterium]|nr:hypothetical protein [Clostridia bacterium]